MNNEGVIGKDILDGVRNSIRYLMENAVIPKVIRTKREAEFCSCNDPFGEEWNIGDEFYLVSIRDGVEPNALKMLAVHPKSAHRD